MSPNCLTTTCLLPESHGDILTGQCWSVSLKGKHSEKHKEVSNQRNHVRFTNVEVKYYPIIIGDSPSVSDGCPVTIDWEPIGISVATVNEFEIFRRNTRRHCSDIKLNELARYEILLDAGYNAFDILEGQRLARQLKSERMSSFYTKVILNKSTTGAESRDEYNTASRTIV